jgi:hypothetical protein
MTSGREFDHVFDDAWKSGERRDKSEGKPARPNPS